MIRTAFFAVLALAALASNAEARQRHKPIVAHPDCNVTMPCEGVVPSARGEMIARKLGFGSAQKVYKPRAQASQPRQRVAAVSPAIVAHPPGCPSRAFCGCGAAVRVFGAPIRSLWLAANWLRFPRTAPAPGMVAARRGHVFVLEQHLGGNTWLAYDANSGGRKTRIHARSIAGYVIVNPRAGAA
jgi:hypothetical protein